MIDNYRAYLDEVEAFKSSLRNWANANIEQISRGQEHNDNNYEGQGAVRVFRRLLSLLSEEMISFDGIVAIWTHLHYSWTTLREHGMPVLFFIEAALGKKKQDTDLGDIDFLALNFLDPNLASALAIISEDVRPLRFLFSASRNAAEETADRDFTTSWYETISQIFVRLVNEQRILNRKYGRMNDHIALLYIHSGWSNLLSLHKNGKQFLSQNNLGQSKKFLVTVVPPVFVPSEPEDEQGEPLLKRKMRAWVTQNITKSVENGQWQYEPYIAGSVRFLTNFREFLGKPEVGDSDIVALFSSIGRGIAMFYGNCLPEKNPQEENGAESDTITVFNLIQFLLNEDALKDVMDIQARVLDPKVTNFTRLLIAAGCFPTKAEDKATHERMDGWISMFFEACDYMKKVNGDPGAPAYFDMMAPCNVPCGNADDWYKLMFENGTTFTI